MLASLLLPLSSRSAVDLLGTPPSALHRVDIAAYPQNFAVAYGGDGRVFLGNAEGVLAFDGEGWRLTRLPHREVVRSLASAADGRLYLGSYNAFGYLQPDSSGSLHYHPLEQLFAEALDGREFADIWAVLVTPECVYFRALTDLFCWRPEDGVVRHWRHPGRFGAMVRHNGETWLQFRGEGLRRQVGDEWQALPGSESLDGLLFGLLPLADGDLLGFGAGEVWWRIDAQGQPSAQRMPTLLPPPAQLQHALAREDGSLLFASSGGALYVVDPTLSEARRFKLGGGVLSGLADGPDGGILVSADSGFHHVRWPSRWTLIGAAQGLQGTLYDIRDWRGQRWLLGASGAQPLQGPGAHEDDRLGPPRWGNSGLHALLPLDPQRALLAQTRQLAWLEGDRLVPVDAGYSYPRMLQRSGRDPSKVLVGSEFGLRIVDIGSWPPQLSASASPELAVRVNSMVEGEQGAVWAGSERHGLWRYRLRQWPDDWESERLDRRLGIETGPVALLAVDGLPGGELLVSTARGFWQGPPEGPMRRVDLHGLEALRGEEEHLRPVLVEGELRWAFSHSRVFERGSQGWQEQSASTLRRGAITAARPLEHGQLLLVSDQALLMKSAQGDGELPPPPPVRLREVWVENADGQRQHLPLAPTSPPEVVIGGGVTHFGFAAMDLDQPEALRYRGRLLGEEAQFSAWAAASTYTYFGLSPGRYTLEVEARDSGGRVSSMAPYTLVILPRWFETLWFQLAAALGALLLFGLGLYALARRRMRRARRSHAALERQVAERTVELAEANRRLRTMAELDGLTGIANRRRLDEYLPLAFAQCAHRGRPLSLLLVDVDHFKRYNDRHGHLAGDELIRRVADLLRSGLRRSEDLVARYGGEEFLIVLPGAGEAVATALAEQLRREAEQALQGMTMSIGVATSDALHGVSPNDLIERADAALYRAKETGRNRVCVEPQG